MIFLRQNNIETDKDRWFFETE